MKVVETGVTLTVAMSIVVMLEVGTVAKITARATITKRSIVTILLRKTMTYTVMASMVMVIEA